MGRGCPLPLLQRLLQSAISFQSFLPPCRGKHWVPSSPVTGLSAEVVPYQLFMAKLLFLSSKCGGGTRGATLGEFFFPASSSPSRDKVACFCLLPLHKLCH